MEAWLHDWLSLLLRWAHFITGVAWIGASFYFNWLENHLQRRVATGLASDDDSRSDPIAGDLWAVHGGGFYYLQKFRVAPPQLPLQLHWFKYEAYFTWLSGFALLGVVYYWNASLFLLGGSGPAITAGQGVVLSLAALLVSWLLYHGACHSPLKKWPVPLAGLVFGWFILLAWALDMVFNARAVYLHIGAAIGTVMVANVFFVIIPAQKELVKALAGQRPPDPAKASDALLRSRHNNYLTLPALFIMISNHYPFAYGGARSLVFLAVFSLAAVGIRHWFNIRHHAGHNRWVLPLSVLLLAGLVGSTLPGKRSVDDDPLAAPPPSTAEIMPVIQQRCSGCHAEVPVMAGFAAPPLGVALETSAAVEAYAERIFLLSVATAAMPLGNLTGMTDEERQRLGRWYAGVVQARAAPN